MQVEFQIGINLWGLNKINVQEIEGKNEDFFVFSLTYSVDMHFVRIFNQSEIDCGSDERIQSDWIFKLEVGLCIFFFCYYYYVYHKQGVVRNEYYIMLSTYGCILLNVKLQRHWKLHEIKM